MTKAENIQCQTGKILPVLIRHSFFRMGDGQSATSRKLVYKKHRKNIKKISDKYIISIFSACVAASIFLGAGTSHAAECHAWPLRESRGGYAYDGDTIYIRMPGLPASIADMSVRVAGIDTPEIRGTCDAEKSRAIQARDRVRDLLDQAVQSGTPILFCDPQWGRYGGRVVASVAIGGGWLHDLMIGEGLARAYDGGKREGWCGAPE